jgi:hypothetical protein
MGTALFSIRYMKHGILYLPTVSNGTFCICVFPFTSQKHAHARTHTHTTLSPYQLDSMQFIVLVRRAAIINTAQPLAVAHIQRHRSTQRLIPQCKYYIAYTKKFHIFHSLIYPLPIFTCPKSFAGYYSCVQGGLTWILNKPTGIESLLTSSYSISR